LLTVVSLGRNEVSSPLITPAAVVDAAAGAVAMLGVDDAMLNAAVDIIDNTAVTTVAVIKVAASTAGAVASLR
jgi:hypothetical protein